MSGFLLLFLPLPLALLLGLDMIPTRYQGVSEWEGTEETTRQAGQEPPA